MRCAGTSGRESGAPRTPPLPAGQRPKRVCRVRGYSCACPQDAGNKRLPFKAPFTPMVPELVRIIRG